MGFGVPAGQATATATGVLSNTLTATGNSQGTALQLPSDFCVFTTVAASTGAIMPATCSPGDWYTVVNHGANTLSLYPPSGGKIKNGSTNAAASVAAGVVAQVLCIDPLTFACATSN